MKGLLIKDGRIIFSRSKKSLLFILVFGLLISYANDSFFLVTWFMLMVSILALNAIAYDEYDNCYSFLMTLPVSRTAYAVEKYVFGMLCSLIFFAVSVVFTCIAFKIKQVPMMRDDRLFIASNILLPLLVLDVSIPVSLKYGSERRRTVLFIAWGAIFALFAVISKVRPGLMPEGVENVSISPAAAAFLIITGAAVLTAVSVFLSIRIMKNKEF